MLGKTVLFEGKGYLEQLEKFVAILGKPTIGIFSNMDPIGEQGLIRAFSEIPDR